MNQKINIPILLGLALCIGLILLVYLVRTPAVKPGSTLAKIISRLVGGILFIFIGLIIYYYYYYPKTTEPIPDPTAEPTTVTTTVTIPEPTAEFTPKINIPTNIFTRVNNLLLKDMFFTQDLQTCPKVEEIFVPSPTTEPTTVTTTVRIDFFGGFW